MGMNNLSLLILIHVTLLVILTNTNAFGEEFTTQDTTILKNKAKASKGKRQKRRRKRKKKNEKKNEKKQESKNEDKDKREEKMKEKPQCFGAENFPQVITPVKII